MALRPLPLFEAAPVEPGGLAYRADFLARDEEQALAARFAELPLKPYEFRGYLAKRRVAYFGSHYDSTARTIAPAEPIPPFLQPLRARAAAFAGLAPAELEHALVAEYAPGVEIGWHKDRSFYDKVVGVSLLSPRVLRFRRERDGGWDRAAHPLAARSAYLLDRAARNEWQHSIVAGDTLRYSVTFRSVRRETEHRWRKS